MAYWRRKFLWWRSQRIWAGNQTDKLRTGEPRLERIPDEASLQRLGSLEGLRQFARVGNTLGTITQQYGHVVILLQRIGQKDTGGDTRAQGIAHQAGQFQDRTALSGGT